MLPPATSPAAASRAAATSSGSTPRSRVAVGEEVVALVVDDDERREVLDLDPPDRLHAQLGVLQDLDLADAVLRQPGAAGPPIEPR